MTLPTEKRHAVIGLLEECEKLSKEILNDFSRASSVETIARKCLLLAKLTQNQREEFFIDFCLTDPAKSALSIKKRLSGKGDIHREELEALVDFLNCFRSDKTEYTVTTLLEQKAIEIKLFDLSLPEAETYVKTARKQLKYTLGQQEFTRSVEDFEAVLNRVKNHLHRFALDTYVQIRFGKIPQSIFEEQRRFVDQKLAVLCPSALEKFAVAYEELQGKSAENWTNAVLACRRILLDFADAVFPPSSDKFKGRDVGPDNYVNRLWAYAETAIESGKNRKLVQAELADLGRRIDAVYDMSCKGVHAEIGKDEADRIVIKTYLLLADLLKLSQ